MTGQGFDTAHMLRRLLLVFSALGLIGLIGLAVWYDSQPSRVERLVACVQKLGYSTNVYHDGGREQFDYPEGTIVLDDGTYQARPPANQIIASLPGGDVATVSVPDGGGTSRTEFSRSVPRTAGQRAAVADCANS